MALMRITYKICRNLESDRWRKRKIARRRTRWLIKQLEVQEEIRADDGNVPQRQAYNLDTSSLTPKQAEVVEAIFSSDGQQVPMSEVALTLKTTVGAVKARWRRLKMQLLAHALGYNGIGAVSREEVLAYLNYVPERFRPAVAMFGRGMLFRDIAQALTREEGKTITPKAVEYRVDAARGAILKAMARQRGLTAF